MLRHNYVQHVILDSSEESGGERKGNHDVTDSSVKGTCKFKASFSQSVCGWMRKECIDGYVSKYDIVQEPLDLPDKGVF